MMDRTTVGLLVLNAILGTVLALVYGSLMVARWMGYS